MVKVFFSFFKFTCVYLFQTSLDGDINQHFEDAIDVIQHHSSNLYYDSGMPENILIIMNKVMKK